MNEVTIFTVCSQKIHNIHSIQNIHNIFVIDRVAQN